MALSVQSDLNILPELQQQQHLFQMECIVAAH